MRYLLLLIKEPNVNSIDLFEPLFFNFNIRTREIVSLTTLMWLLDLMSDLLKNTYFSEYLIKFKYKYLFCLT